MYCNSVTQERKPLPVRPYKRRETVIAPFYCPVNDNRLFVPFFRDGKTIKNGGVSYRLVAGGEHLDGLDAIVFFATSRFHVVSVRQVVEAITQGTAERHQCAAGRALARAVEESLDKLTRATCHVTTEDGTGSTFPLMERLPQGWSSECASALDAVPWSSPLEWSKECLPLDEAGRCIATTRLGFRVVVLLMMAARSRGLFKRQAVKKPTGQGAERVAMTPIADRLGVTERHYITRLEKTVDKFLDCLEIKERDGERIYTIKRDVPLNNIFSISFKPPDDSPKQ